MPSSRTSSVRSSRPSLHGPFAVVALAILASLPTAAAQGPPRSRDELLLQWDLDRNGTVDDAEAEVAKTRMRRARVEALRNPGTDPLTGKPRPKTEPVTGRPRPQDGGPGDDDLILVPGNGDRPEQAARPKVAAPTKRADEDDAAEMQRPKASDRPALPGTRVPQAGSLTPSVRPKDLAPSVPGVAGRGPAGGTGPAAAPPRQPWEQLRVQPRPSAAPATADRPPSLGPGVISGGLRAGAAPARPGYGAPGTGPDLNAGRMSSAPAPSRGRTAGNAAAAAPGPTGGPADGASSSRPGMLAPIFGGSRPLPAQGSAAGGATGPRSGMQPARPPLPATGARPPAGRPPVSRVPNGGADAFFDR